MCNFEECPKCSKGMVSLDGGWCVWYCPNCRWLSCNDKNGIVFERKLRKEVMEKLK